jgi:hypothetical protein
MVGSNAYALVSITDGTRQTLPERPAPAPRANAGAGGFRLDAITSPGQAYPFANAAYRLVDVSGRLAPLEFEAWTATLAPDGALFIVTPPGDRQPQGGVIRGFVAAANILQVDAATGAATWIGSVRGSLANLPFVANDHFVAWTDEYCDVGDIVGGTGVSNGHTRIYDRRAGTLVELDEGLFVAALTPGNRLAVGSFGADALVDLDTFQYVFGFPQTDRTWSADYRYAAVSRLGGHGGNCGGE